MEQKEKLEEAKRLYETANADQRYVLESLFPELKKSEDEKIRKFLIEDIKDTLSSEDFKYYNLEHTKKLEEALAWLEKQGEQKEINLIEILKHYPRETELYSPLYGKLWLAKVDEKNEIITCYKYPLNKGCTRAILEQEETVSFYSNGTTGLPDFNISKDCMLFLYDIEKQGEKNPTDKVKPKFQEGDWVVNKLGNIWHIDSFDAKNYQVTNNKGEHNYFPIDIQDRMRLWTIQDAKKGDILQADKCTLIFDFLTKDIDNQTVISSWYFCDSKKFYGMGTSESDLWYIAGVVPATKEQCDFLFAKMKDAGYEWDAEKKKLKRFKDEKQIKKNLQDNSFSRMFEQKSKWSGDDNEHVKSILERLEGMCKKGATFTATRFAVSQDIDWLKSLKQKLG